MDYLKNLEENISLALMDENVTSSQIVSIIRQTLVKEADNARAAAKKATDTLDALKVPYQYAIPDYLTNPTASSDSISFTDTTFPAAAYFTPNDGIFGGAGQDTISLG